MSKAKKNTVASSEAIKLLIILYVKELMVGHDLHNILRAGSVEPLPFGSLAWKIHHEIMVNEGDMTHRLNSFMSHPASQGSLIREALRDMYYTPVHPVGV